jgi:S1-C subfamily serine protease
MIDINHKHIAVCPQTIIVEHSISAVCKQAMAHIINCISSAIICAICGSVIFAASMEANNTHAEFGGLMASLQAKMVKINGAGGYRGLKAYQSGLLISSEGHILTAYSFVLDTDDITVILADGRKLSAKLLGADPKLEMAVLKVDAANLPYFNLNNSQKAAVGDNVLALSNLYNIAVGDEPVSVQHGIISAVTKLEARRGTFDTPYRGTVFVLDVKTNNPGSAGGALVGRNGELLAVLGKELRNAMNNTWLSYAVPIDEIRPSIDVIRAGKFVARRNTDSNPKPPKSISLDTLGIILVPDVLERTPPYIEHIRANSPAEKSGLQPDDLVVLLGDRLVQSCKQFRSELEYTDVLDSVRITIVRNGELMEFVLRESPDKNNKP